LSCKQLTTSKNLSGIIKSQLQYKKSHRRGFEGFIDELKIIIKDNEDKKLLVRGWGSVNEGELLSIHCINIPDDKLIFKIQDFFSRPDLPTTASAFEIEIPIDNKSSNLFDFAFLAESRDEKLFPIFQHSPINTQIELDGRCNLACVMCPQAFGIHSGPLALEDLNRLEPLLLESECIEINHQGESLLSPILHDLLSIIPPHKQIAFNTNGTALKSKVSKLILENSPPIRFLSISLDAATEESFFKIRGTSLKKILEIIKVFKNARDSKGIHFPEIAITCTVLKDFMHEVPDLVKIAGALGASFKYWPLAGSGLHGGKDWVTNYHGTQEPFIYDEQVPRDSKSWREMCEKIEFNAKKFNVDIIHPFQYQWVAFDDATLKPKKDSDISDCPEIKRHRFFNANGNAQMCCVQTKPLFNWRVNGPESFDSNAAVIETREQAKNGVIPDACSGACCSYVAGELSPVSLRMPLTYILRKFI
jgi:MoaA/NifB/PqqE/SkfB family radical SAM enzyme